MIDRKPIDGALERRTTELTAEIAERRRAEESMAAVARIGRIVSSTLNIDEAYDRFASEARKLIPFDRLAVSLHRQGMVTIAYISGGNLADRMPGDSFPLEGTVTQLLIRTRKAFLLHPRSVEEVAAFFPPLIPTYKAGLRSMISVPLIFRDEVIGVLSFRSIQPDAYTERDLQLAETIGEQIAGTIANARLFADLKREESEKAVIAEIGRIISSSLNIDEVYDRFADEARKLILYDRLTVNLVHPQSGTLTLAYVYGMAMVDRRQGDAVPLEGSLTADLIRTRTGFVLNATSVEALARDYPAAVKIYREGVRSLICVPLISHGEVIGSLNFRSKTANAYKERELSLAQRIGDQIAGAIASAQLYADLKGEEQKEQAMAEIGRIIGSSLNIDEVYERFSQEAKKLIGFDKLSVSLNDLTAGVVRMAYVVQAGIMGRQQGDVHPLAGSINENVMKAGKGLIVELERIGEIEEHYPTLVDAYRAGARSALSVPLFSHGAAIACLNFRSRKPHAYSSADLRLAERIGEQIAGAIANAQMFNDLSNTEKSLQESKERLQRAEKMEALGTLAGGVAHDLNNVLGIVVGYAEMLLDEIGKEHPLRTDVMKIMEGGQRAAAIIQDLLTLARRGVQTMKAVNLNAIVSDCQRMPEFEKLLSFHPKVRITTELEDDILNIMGSPVHLQKTIMNLVSNAAEAMPDGGLLTIGTSTRNLEKPVHGYDDVNEGDSVVLSVTDTGEGISDRDINHIYEPFYTKKVMGRSGTGLGLAVVWGTVKDHSGYIDVQSEVGRGTTFTLYFPVARGENVETAAAIPLSEYIGHDESILVIDDIKEQRDLAAKMLGKLNYKVKTVASGEEAVEYLKHEKADLIVLDMIMEPGMDGLETYKAVINIHPHQKAIIVSGFSETERVTEARALGAGGYVRKPYVQEKLAMAVRQELSRKHPT